MQSRKRRATPNLRNWKRGGREKTLPVFLRSQDLTTEPTEFQPLDECTRLFAANKGCFINQGRAFRRFDRSRAADLAKDYEASGRRGVSLKIAEPAPSHRHSLGAMSRYVEDKLAGKLESENLAAVNGWNPKRYEFPYIFRWDRCGRKNKPCRIAVRGRKMNSLLLEFEDGFRMVTSANAVKRAPEFRDSCEVRRRKVQSEAATTERKQVAENRQSESDSRT